MLSSVTLIVLGMTFSTNNGKTQRILIPCKYKTGQTQKGIIMTNTTPNGNKKTERKFNLVKYVYGRIYSAYLESGECNTFEIEDVKTRSWTGILYWLKKENHIQSFEFGKTLKDGFKVTFVGFNTKNTMYDYYLRAIRNRMMLDDDTRLARDKSQDNECPFDGHIVELTEQQNRERIENSDRTTLELNREISKELVAQ